MYVFGAFVLSIYYLVQAETKKWWMYIIPVIILLSPNILNPAMWWGDFSRGIIGEAQITSYVTGMSLIGLLVVWLISKIKDIRIKTKVAYSTFGLVMLGGLFFAVSLLSATGYIRGAYLERASEARPLVWELSQDAIKERPWFGWGTDNFERVFEARYDNRLLEARYGNEAWFDRAHNVFIDQMVDNGIIGLLTYIALYLVTLWCLIYSALHSSEKKDRTLAAILSVYVTLHFLELQTAFDTSISYPMTVLVLALAVNLFHSAHAHRKQKECVYTLSAWLTYASASIVGIFLIWSFFWGWIPFVRAQIANGSIRTVGSSVARLPFYPTLFNSPVDEHAFLWRTMTDFQRGIGQKPSILNDAQKVEGLKKEAALFTRKYEEYVETHPTHFRAHLNLADILIYQRLFEVDKLAQAQEVLDAAIELVPTSPQAYWMKAVAYVYMRKFELAREYAKKGLELNPDITQSQEVVKYVETSIKNFPNIDLFFFKQI
jgi:tetratricopeptide (TPR) repeat protein